MATGQGSGVPPRRPSGPSEPFADGIGLPGVNALLDTNRQGTYWANIYGPSNPTVPLQVEDGRPSEYNRLNSTNTPIPPLRSMEYGAEDHVPPSFKDQCSYGLRWALREWRTLSLLLLLTIICILIGDVDVNVRWKVAEDFTPPITYEFMQKAMRRHTGFLSFYTLPSDSKVLLMEFPLPFLASEGGSKPVIISASYSRGLWDESKNVYLYHGPAEATDHNVFVFNLTADRSGVDVIRKQYGVRTSDPQSKLAVKMGALSSRVATLPIVAINDARPPSVVVNGEALLASGFFVGDTQGATEARLVPSSCAAYPRNLDINVDYMMPTDPKDPTTLVPVSLAFSLALLPDVPLTPRALDSRVGFFYISYTDIGDHRQNANISTYVRHESDAVDARIRAINRRRIKSGPDMQPITYYIDPSVPERWRQSFREGVEGWVPAFSAAGFGEKAIRAILPGDADWPKDYAAGDIRYSTISWTVDMDNTFALGPSIVDPRSGEILDSDIIFTNGWLKHYISTIESQDVTHTYTSPSRSLSSDSPAHSHSHSHSHSHDHHHGHSHDDDLPHLGSKYASASKSGMHGSSLRSHRHGACQEAKAHFDLSPHLARLAFAKESGVDEEILKQGIREVVMHEVGHTLGLRHNFKASSAITWDQTQDKTYTQEHGLTLSVMDYLPMNLVSGRQAGDQVDYFTPVIGEYDIMAIRYGYSEVKDEKPGMPHPDLVALADLNLPFATDEDDSSENGPDPSVSVFDFTSDPARFFLDRLDLVSELRPTLLDRSVFVGDEYTRLASAETTLIKTALHAAQFLCKYIGGHSVTRATRTAALTQPPPIAAVSGAEQARALAGVLRVLSDDDGLLPSPDMAPYLLEKGGTCEGLFQYCLARSPADMLTLVDAGRIKLLKTLLEPGRLSRLRVADWTLKGQGKASLGVSDLFGNTTEALWGKDMATSARLTDTRTWSVALAYVDILIELSRSRVLPPELAAIAGGELFKLQDSIEGATLDKASKAYPLLRLMQRKIDEAHMVLDPPAAPAKKEGEKRRRHA